MALGKGIAAKAAVKVETGAYGTAIALDGVGEKNQIHLISESLSKNTNYEKSATLDGDVAVKSQYKVLDKYTGDLVVEAHYSGLERFFACLLGMSHQSKSPVYFGGGAYRHYFEPSNDLSTRAFTGYEMTTPSGDAIRRMTVGIEKDVSIWEFVSTMIDSMTFEVTPERVQATFSMVAKTMNQDSATNSTSTNWDLPSESQVLFGDAELYLVMRDQYQVETGINETFVVDEGGGAVTLSLTDGTYQGGELAQEIETALNSSTSLSNTYTVRYLNDERRFIFKADAAFIIKGTGTMNKTLGLSSSDTASDTMHSSVKSAVPETYSGVEIAANKVSFSKITITVNNNLDADTQDSLSEQEIVEPERNGMREVKVSLEVPRYKNDELIKAAQYNTIYVAVLKFTGNTIVTGYDEELKFIFPQLKFNTASAPVSGADIIKMTFELDAQDAARFYDFKSFFIKEYFFRATSVASQNIFSIGAYVDGLYAGGQALGAAKLMKWDGSTWTDVATTAVDWINDVQMYNNNLYLAATDGFILEYDGTTVSTSCDVGTGEVKDLEVYGDKLYACENGTGKVFEFDGSTWSLSCDTVATVAHQLKAYDGALYFAAYDTNGKVYKFDGTTWSLSCDFGLATVNVMALEVHDGHLFLSTVDTVGASLYKFDGTTWTKVTSLTFEVKFMLSYRDNLLLFPNGAAQDIYFYSESYDPTALADGYTLIDSSINLEYQAQPKIFNGKFFVPVASSTQLQMFSPIQDILIVNQNTNSSNPL